MMITLEHGDILQADAEALVNTVNCVGVMGRGIALQFSKAFPGNFDEYKKACDHNQLHPGMMLVYSLGRLHNPRYVINFPTKRHWKEKSKIEYIQLGLRSLVEEVDKRNIRSIAIPPLGCGLGGLDWQQVRPMIESAFAALPEVEVLLYEPVGAPVAKAMVKTQKAPTMTIGRAALLGLVRRYLAAVMDPFVTLLEIHKLMYFMQEAGEPLRLCYCKAPYGPYAKNLRHVLSHIEGHFISGFGDAHDDPEKQIELIPDAAEQAETFLRQNLQTSQRFNRVSDLIEGFETPFGMELLATVHWVGTREQATTLDEAISKTYAWNRRKQMFEKQHIQIAWNILHKKGWLTRAELKGATNVCATDIV